jgi:hypothetical protein
MYTFALFYLFESKILLGILGRIGVLISRVSVRIPKVGSVVETGNTHFILESTKDYGDIVTVSYLTLYKNIVI